MAVLSLACISTSSFAIDITCQYNSNTGVLEATLPWRNTLGSAADHACADADARRLILNSRNGIQTIGPQSAKEISYTKSSVIAVNEHADSMTLPANSFVSKPSDKTALQLIARWAKQAGYEMQLNNEPVNNSFPKHKVSYADVPLTKLQAIQPAATFASAVYALRTQFTAAKFDALVFEAVTDPQVHIVYLKIYEKPNSKNKAS